MVAAPFVTTTVICLTVKTPATKSMKPSLTYAADCPAIGCREIAIEPISPGKCHAMLVAIALLKADMA